MRLALQLLAALGVLAALIRPSLQTRSHIIDFAPEALVVDDISAEKCKREIGKYCSSLTGEGVLADCINELIMSSEIEESDAVISDACRDAFYQFHIQRSRNINSNLPLARACKAVAATNCNIPWLYAYPPGQVIGCLKGLNHLEQLAPDCRHQLLKVQQQAAQDYRADAQLYAACKDDAAALCSDVEPGGGRVQSCLRRKRLQLTWSCGVYLRIQDSQSADDAGLTPRFYSSCLVESKTFCQDMTPGSALLDCLMKRRGDEGFSQECQQEVEEMFVALISRRYDYDARLHTTCGRDLSSLLLENYGGDKYDLLDYVPNIQYLQDYLHQIADEDCRAVVYKYKQLAASDIRFNPRLFMDCYEDRQKLCATTAPVSTMRCLAAERLQLQSGCRGTLLNEQVAFAESLDFQLPMKAACEREVATFCKHVPHSQAQSIRCLQTNVNNRGFEEACRREVALYNREAVSDYRLNHRLAVACKADIHTLCEGACKIEPGQVCGGMMLRCLMDKWDKISSECQQEVDFAKQLAAPTSPPACHLDVETYCTGEVNVLRCLRQHQREVSPACREEAVVNVQLRFSIVHACSKERFIYCKELQWMGPTRVVHCLTEKMDHAMFSTTCRTKIVELQRRLVL